MYTRSAAKKPRLSIHVSNRIGSSRVHISNINSSVLSGYVFSCLALKDHVHLGQTSSFFRTVSKLPTSWKKLVVLSSGQSNINLGRLCSSAPISAVVITDPIDHIGLNYLRNTIEHLELRSEYCEFTDELMWSLTRLPLKYLRLPSHGISELSDVGLRFIRKLLLQYLWMGATHITTLQPLADMPLRSLTLSCYGGGLCGLQHLYQLETLQLYRYTGLTDLSPLQNLPLTSLSLLYCINIKTKDVETVVPGLVKLTDLRVVRTCYFRVSCLSRLPLEHLHVERYPYGKIITQKEVDSLPVSVRYHNFICMYTNGTISYGTGITKQCVPYEWEHRESTSSSFSSTPLVRKCWRYHNLPLTGIRHHCICSHNLTDFVICEEWRIDDFHLEY
jgi:hypothetical protein